MCFGRGGRYYWGCLVIRVQSSVECEGFSAAAGRSLVHKRVDGFNKEVVKIGGRMRGTRNELCGHGGTDEQIVWRIGAE